MKNFAIVISFGWMLLFTSCKEQQPNQLSSFPLSCVRLLDSPLKHASQTNEAYVMAHNPDRLLAPFLIDAGIPVKAPQYGNWENTGLDGHIGGHYLTSLSLIVASTGNQEAAKRLNYMVEQLAICQKKNGNGYVGGIPDGKTLWTEIAAGKIEFDNFSLNGKWVPWYNIHKLFAGLRDAWLYAGNEQALEVLKKLSEWTSELCSHLDDAKMQQMLICEHGGMNEVFADVYGITGDPKYLDLARRFSDRSILNPLLKHEDKLTGLHANTQIPKVIGFMRIAELSGDTAWQSASSFFWDDVVTTRSVAIGGNSVSEHFHSTDDFTSMIESREGPETCNTYNMMKLSRQLYFATNDLKYIDFYEKALYNHILSSQHPNHGGLVYFTSMRPGHYRVYSDAEESFWCCVGSGIENHAKYGELIYAHDNSNVFVNLYVPSVLRWKEKGITLTQTNHIPEKNQSTIELNLDQDQEFAINLRHPSWVKDNMLNVKINNQDIKVQSKAGEYVSINRLWHSGDKIVITLPMSVYGEYLGNKTSSIALKYGPVVLASEVNRDNVNGLIADGSRMGHIAQGPLLPVSDLPVLMIDGDDWAQKIKQMPGDSLCFDASELMHPKGDVHMKLIPFYQLHDARYIIYWPTVNSLNIDSVQQILKQQEQIKLELERMTIDQIAPGEQQPESDHHFKGEESQTGIHMERHWRHAAKWFSYELNDKNKLAKRLRITYFGLDANRQFDITINDTLISSVNLTGEHGNQIFDVDYEIPTSVVKNNKAPFLIVKFIAHDGSIAGGIYHVRLLK